MFACQLRKYRLEIFQSIFGDGVIILIFDGCVDQLLNELPSFDVEESLHGDFVDRLIVLHISEIVAPFDAVDLIFVVIEGIFALLLFVEHYEYPKEGIQRQFGQFKNDLFEDLSHFCSVVDGEVSKKDPLLTGPIVMLKHLDQFLLFLHIDQYALQLSLLAERFHL